MAPAFFKIDGRSIASGKWGDYGRILQHGMTAHLKRSSGRLCLERTGPYIPPITFPGIGDILLTDAARALLASSGMGGFGFEPVEKRLIVKNRWEKWDLSSAEPAEYPDSGEPEDYILGQPHCPETALVMGDVLELVVPLNVVIVRPHRGVNSFTERYIDLKSWGGEDLLRSKEFGGVLFSQRAKDWFSAQWSQWVEFEKFPAR